MRPLLELLPDGSDDLRMDGLFLGNVQRNRFLVTSLSLGRAREPRTEPDQEPSRATTARRHTTESRAAKTGGTLHRERLGCPTVPGGATCTTRLRDGGEQKNLSDSRPAGDHNGDGHAGSRDAHPLFV